MITWEVCFWKPGCSPPLLVNAVSNHHHPHRVPSENGFLLAVHLADLLSHMVVADPGGEAITLLENHLLLPENISLANRFGFQLTKMSLHQLRKKLAQEIEKEAATIALLSGPSQ